MNWRVRLTNGDVYSGLTDNGSWQNLNSILDTYKPREKISKMWIENSAGGASIDENTDGYFLANKAVGIMPSYGNTVNLVAIGYWRKNDNFVRMLWYNSDNMNLVQNEARPVSECENFMIKNI